MNPTQSIITILIALLVPVAIYQWSPFWATGYCMIWITGLSGYIIDLHVNHYIIYRPPLANINFEDEYQ